MKHWPSQLFPVIMLSLLAGLSFWLQKAIESDDRPRDGKLRHERDAMAENFSVVRLDADGRIKYRLIAPYMEHFPDDDSSLVRSPTLVSYRADAEPVILSSHHAKISAKGEVTFLWDNVVAHREATVTRPAMVARMPDLTVQNEAGFAFTSSPVEITQGESWIRGTGMELDNNNSTLILRSQVTGLYHRPKASP